jgi:hypothetical protein
MPRKAGRSEEREQITNEMEARAMRALLWLALCQADRIAWAAASNVLVPLFEQASKRERELMAPNREVVNSGRV